MPLTSITGCLLHSVSEYRCPLPSITPVGRNSTRNVAAASFGAAHLTASSIRKIASSLTMSDLVISTMSAR